MARDISVYVSNNTPRRVQTMHVYDSVGNRQKIVRGYAYDSNGDLRQVFPGFIEKTYTHATGGNTALPASTLLRVHPFVANFITQEGGVSFIYDNFPNDITPTPPMVGVARVNRVETTASNSLLFFLYYPVGQSFPTINSAFNYVTVNGNIFRTTDPTFNDFVVFSATRQARWTWINRPTGIVAGNSYPLGVAVPA